MSQLEIGGPVILLLSWGPDLNINCIREIVSHGASFQPAGKAAV